MSNLVEIKGSFVNVDEIVAVIPPPANYAGYDLTIHYKSGLEQCVPCSSGADQKDVMLKIHMSKARKIGFGK